MDKAEFLIRYAILAPNSHNTQPWRFEITKESIQLLPDLERSLYYSDRENRELYISLGCALGNLLVAADYFGFNVRIEYLPECTFQITRARLLCTKLKRLLQRYTRVNDAKKCTKFIRNDTVSSTRNRGKGLHDRNTRTDLQKKILHRKHEMFIDLLRFLSR